MDLYGVDIKGKFKNEKLTSLPTWTTDDIGREVYITDGTRYYGGDTEWILYKDNKIIVSSTDTTRNYLNDKITSTSGNISMDNDMSKRELKFKQSDPNEAWNITVYWQTLLHGESTTYSVSAEYDADTNYDYKTIGFNIQELASDITDIRIDINYDDWDNVSTGVFEFDYISINNTELDTWTGSDCTLSLTPSTMIMTPNSWTAEETEWIMRTLGT